MDCCGERCENRSRAMGGNGAGGAYASQLGWRSSETYARLFGGGASSNLPLARYEVSSSWEGRVGRQGIARIAHESRADLRAELRGGWRTLPPDATHHLTNQSAASSSKPGPPPSETSRQLSPVA